MMGSGVRGSPWGAGHVHLDEATAVSQDQLGRDPEPLDGEHVKRTLPGRLAGQGLCGCSRHLGSRGTERQG